MTVDAEPLHIPTLSALRRAFREAPALGTGFVPTLLLAVLGTAGQLVVPIVIQRITDKQLLAPEGPDVGQVILLGLAALALLALAAWVTRIAVIRLSVNTAGGLAELRMKLFRHLHRLSIIDLQTERRGALVSRVTSDINTIQEFTEWGGIGMVVGSAQIVLSLMVMFFYQWQLALLVLGGVVVYALMVAWFQRRLQKAHDGVRERVADSLAVMGETITGLQVVRAYGVEDVTLARVRNTLQLQVKAEHRANTLTALFFSSAELFAASITAGVVAMGILIGPDLGTSAGTLLAFLFLTNLMIEPIQTLVETIDQAQRAAAGVRRVLRVLDSHVSIPDPEDGVALPAGGLGATYRHVSLHYPGGAEPALSDVSVDIEPGQRLAVVGETGSGKTTFAKLMTRLLDPTEGAIALGGVPLTGVRFDSLRKRVAFVPQEGFLFSASVGDNVRYGKPNATDRELETAFLELGLGSWLDRLPDGLTTQVGERGGNLSAGERQLVAIVRAWISEPDLLVLDEATSAVDPALDVQLREAIERLTRGRTSVTIAHRLSTAEAADRVLVFDEGKLVEDGRHIELLAAGGVYASLYRDWSAGTREV
jgi:putative ABC transport system ATP-binding protein